MTTTDLKKQNDKKIVLSTNETQEIEKTFADANDFRTI
jgi:hypothetical protein